MSITFGKYKGKSVSFVKMDKQYCEWMKTVAKKEPYSVIGKFVNRYLSEKEDDIPLVKYPISDNLFATVSKLNIKLCALNKETGRYVYPKIADILNEYKCPECGKDVVYSSKTECFRHKYESSFKCNYYSSPSESQVKSDGKLLFSKLVEDGVQLSVSFGCTMCKCKYDVWDDLDVECIHLGELNSLVNGMELTRESIVRVCSTVSRKCKGCVFYSRFSDIYLYKYVRYKLGQTVFSELLLSECEQRGLCKCDYCLLWMNEHLELDPDACEDSSGNKRIVDKFGEYFVDKKPIIHSREYNYCNVKVVPAKDYHRYPYWDYYSFGRCNLGYPMIEEFVVDHDLETIDRMVAIIKRVGKYPEESVKGREMLRWVMQKAFYVSDN